MLTAVVNGRTLLVSGAAAREGFYPVGVATYLGGDTIVSDNDAGTTRLTVAGDLAALRHIDFSGVTGAATSLSAYGLVDRRVWGSAQGDWLYLGGGADRVWGGEGSDSLYGNDGADELDGGAASDGVYGGAGDDVLRGGAGDDLLVGGAGSDVAVYAGNRADYRVEAIEGDWRVTDLRARTPDGVDVVAVESLRFADTGLALDPVASRLSAAVAGRTLTVGGTAARGASWAVTIALGADAGVTDNNATATNVAVTGDTSDIRVVDLTALAGAGVSLTATGSVARRVAGTAQADYVYLASGADRANGGGGDDALHGNDGADELDGGAGADTLWGGAGDDGLRGGAGADVLEGGAGFDTAVYVGNRADYRVDVIDGNYRVADLRAKAPDGVDVLHDVEALRFADGTVALAAPSGLAAAFEGRALTVSGAAARSGFDVVSIVTTLGGETRVTDNDARATPVTIAGEPAVPRTIDVGGLTGAATSISAYGLADRRVFGSAQGDYVYTDGGNDRLFGAGGSDTLLGNGGSDELDGGLAADALLGGDGDDLLRGGAGDDRLDGGDGIDAALFAGNRADYAITADADGALRVTDLRARAPDGSDTLVSVELLRFADLVVTAEAAWAPHDAALLL